MGEPKSIRESLRHPAGWPAPGHMTVVYAGPATSTMALGRAHRVDPVEFLFEWGTMQPRPKWEIVPHAEQRSLGGELPMFEGPSAVLAEAADVHIETREDDRVRRIF